MRPRAGKDRKMENQKQKNSTATPLHCQVIKAKKIPPMIEQGMSATRKAEGQGLNTFNAYSSWPVLKQEALYGLAGDVVKTIEPHTESDPVALLINFLACFGNVVGDGPHFLVESTVHPLRLNAVIVGDTSKGRKGTSWERVEELFGQVDANWVDGHIFSGLSSGEGLIWAVRDEIKRKEPIKKGGKVTGYQEVVADEGVRDKRLLVLETEFSSVLKVAGRDGNTLSAVVRQSWDTGRLRILTKNSPANATGAHISILGHITKEELLKHLDSTEASNGFGNRIVWVCVKRSKCLPEGGGHVDLSPLVARLKQVVDFAKGVGEVKRDEEARAIWYEVYPSLSEGKPGLLGALTARAEAYVMRIACIYALLDLSPIIRQEHLLASLALWDYCERSTGYIFGDATGDCVADRILQAIRQNPEEGLSRSDIYSTVFRRNVKSGKIDTAVLLLLSLGRVRVGRKDTGGRPTEVILLNNYTQKTY